MLCFFCVFTEASLYDASKAAFTCFDGSNKIPFAYVNDDYCDCHDASDEPGESGPYFCGILCNAVPNVGRAARTAQTISSSRFHSGRLHYEPVVLVLTTPVLRFRISQRNICQRNAFSALMLSKIRFTRVERGHSNPFF